MRRMERREFIKFCAASAVTGTPAIAADARPRPQRGGRAVRVTDRVEGR